MTKSKRLLVVISMVLTVVLAMGLTACSKTEKAPDTKESAAAPKESAPAEKKEEAKPSAAAPKEIKRIALLLPGSITDKSWNAGAHSGLMKLKDSGYETAFTENVKNSDIETTFRNYATQGYELMMGHGFEFGDGAIKVAPQFPDKYFFVFGKMPPNVEAPKNVAFVDQKEYESAYLCGIVAGLTTKSNKIGFLGGMESPSQISNKNAYTEGAKSVNPKVEVIAIMSGSFDDPAKGKEAGLAQIEKGADILMHTCDLTGMGMIEAAKSKNVKIIGYGGDQMSLAPDLMLTSLIDEIPAVIAEQVKKIKDGSFGGVWSPGIKENVIQVGSFGPAVSEETKKKVEEVKNDIISGKFVVPAKFE